MLLGGSVTVVNINITGVGGRQLVSLVRMRW